MKKNSFNFHLTHLSADNKLNIKNIKRLYNDKELLSRFISGAVFNDGEYENIKLNNIKIKGTSFIFANLNGSDFSNSYITGCDFTFANLTNCNFQGAIIEDCLFRHTILKKTKFFNTNIVFTDFTGATL